MDKKESESDHKKITYNVSEDKSILPSKSDVPIENNLHEQALSDAQISKLNAIKSLNEPKINQQKRSGQKINEYSHQNGNQQGFSQNSWQNNWNGFQRYNNNQQNTQNNLLPFGDPYQRNKRRDWQGGHEQHGHGRKQWRGHHEHRGHHGYRGYYGHHGFQTNQYLDPQSHSHGYPPPPPPHYPHFQHYYGNNLAFAQQAPNLVYNAHYPQQPQYPQFPHYPQPPPPPPSYQLQQLPPFVPPQRQMQGRHHRGRGCRGGRGDKFHKKGRKGSDSSSSSSSSSQKSRNKSKGKKCSWKEKQKHSSNRSEEAEKYERQIYQHYSKKMNGFFQSRQINEVQRDKIINVLKRSYPGFEADISRILRCLQQIEAENLTFRMSYVKIIKVLIKFRLDLPDAKQRLEHIQRKKIKKYEADKNFQETYGGKQISPMMEVNDLIKLAQCNLANILYLVDGNNIMPTNKHLRKYFQNRNHLYKISAQLRCRWYFSHVFNKQNIILFFDEKFSKQDEDRCKAVIFDSEQQQKRAMDLQVVYGQNEKADEKIVSMMKSMIENDDKRQVVLVTADRDLTMRCQDFKIMLYTSGKYFFKFCKYRINRNYKDKKPMKRLAKSILQYYQLY